MIIAFPTRHPIEKPIQDAMPNTTTFMSHAPGKEDNQGDIKYKTTDTGISKTITQNTILIPTIRDA